MTIHGRTRLMIDGINCKIFLQTNTQAGQQKPKRLEIPLLLLLGLAHSIGILF